MSTTESIRRDAETEQAQADPEQVENRIINDLLLGVGPVEEFCAFISDKYPEWPLEALRQQPFVLAGLLRTSQPEFVEEFAEARAKKEVGR